MKILLIFLFILIPFPVYTQIFSAKPTSLIENPIKKIKIKNETPSIYYNPEGKWKSSSGNNFYIINTPDGFIFQNTANGDKYIAYSTVHENFYSSDFYFVNNNQFAFSQYYIIIDSNTIKVEKSNGESFVWRRQ